MSAAVPFSARTNAAFLWQQALAGGRTRLALATGGVTLAALCALPQAGLLAKLIDAALTPDSALSLPTLGALLAVILLRAFSLYVGESRAALMSATARVHLRHRAFGALLELGPVAAARQEAGAWTTTLIERIEALDGYLARYIPQTVAVTVTLPVILITVSLFSLWTAGILLVALLLAPVLMAFVGILAARASRRQFSLMSRLGGAFLDRLRNLELLRVFGATAREADTLRTIADSYRQRTLGVLRLAFLSSASLELMAMGAIALTAIHLMHGALPRTQALFVLLLVPEFFAPLRAMLAGYHDRATALAAVDGLRPLLETPKTAGVHWPVSLPEPLSAPDIEFQGVSFTHDTRPAPVLADCGFRVEGGEFLAIRGVSGAGKSTLLSLLLGFIAPQAGTIRVAGCPLDHIDPVQRAGLFAWVGQRSRLFYGTLAENVKLGCSHASEAEVMQALDQAGLSSLLETLPQGLNTVIGEHGFGLSGGQAQRVALARAFVRQAPVLLLDEPTAGLDEETAHALMQAVRRVGEGRTVVMVSHDETALSAADRVVELRDGQCVS